MSDARTIRAICPKCGGDRVADKLMRDKLRKHGKADWCSNCYSKLAQKIRNARVAPDRKRQWNLTSRYGLKSEEVQEMLNRQGGKCAICRTALKKHHVDHCHATGRVRGILCHGCNMKLPIVENDCLLQSALAYLRGGA